MQQDGKNASRKASRREAAEKRKFYETLNEYHRDLRREVDGGDLTWEQYERQQVSQRATQRLEKAFVNMFKDFRKNGIRTGLVENET